MLRNTEKILIAWFCIVAAGAAMGTPAKNNGIPAELTQQFVGKTFQLKTRIGSYMDAGAMQNGQQCLRLIDTEYRPDGSIRYQGRRGCFSANGDLVGELFSSNFYVEPDRLTAFLGAGTNVSVVKLESKEDRIEFWLNAVPNTGTVASYGKLKLFIPKGSSTEEVLAAAANIFRIERYERMAVLESDYQQLTYSLQNQRTRYTQMLDPMAKIALAREIQTTYRNITENRRNFVAAGGKTTVNGYQPEIEALDRDIAGLEGAAREQRVQQLQAQFQANHTQRAELLNQLQQPITNNADLDRRLELAKRYRDLLQSGQDFLNQMAHEGKPLAGGAEEVAADREVLNRVTSQFGSDRKRLQLAQLNNEYHEMEKRRIKLIGAYTQSAGTPQQGAALNAVMAELQSMIRNRNAAKDLGYAAAVKQVAQIEAELASLKGK